MIKRQVLLLLFSIFIIEAIGWALAFLDIEPTGFRLHLNLEAFDNTMPYADIDSLVGVWHKPDDYWIINGACFTAQERSNRYGATDNEWDTTKKGYFFAGSSFIEGYGIEFGYRCSEIFEKLTGEEVFNCGMGGTFSPVQSFLTLKKFSNVLKFDTCFVFLIIPADEQLLSTIDSTRYRPYWFNDSIFYQRKTTFLPKKGVVEKCQNFLMQYSYLYHLYDYFKNRNASKSAILNSETKNNLNLEKLKAINELFCKNYPGKFFYFVLIPTLDNNNQPFSFNKTFANQKLLDLRNSLDQSKDFYTCNPHWNKDAHFRFATALKNAYK